MNAHETLKVSNAERSFWAMNEGAVEPAHMVTMASEIDASAVRRLRENFRTAGPRVPSYTAIAIRAAARVLAEHPEANRGIMGLPGFRRLVQFHSDDIAVAAEKDLPLAPGTPLAMPIRGCTSKPLLEITDELHALVTCDEHNNAQYARYIWILKHVPAPLSAWLIKVPQWFPSQWTRYRGAAAYVNAPTRAGVDLVVSVWPWPITFSFGVVKERPIVIDGHIEARYTMPLSMSFDRRIMGGGPASRVFATYQRLLHDADTLLTDDCSSGAAQSNSAARP